MAAVTSQPGPVYKAFEAQIVNHKEIAAQYKKEARCKIIQAIAFAALFIIAAVGAFILASLYAPNYAPIILFIGSYLLIEHIGNCIRNFKSAATSLDAEAERIQAIAQKHINLGGGPDSYLAAHFEYWKEDAEKALVLHQQHADEAQNLLESEADASKMPRNNKIRMWKSVVHAQQARERALQSKIEAAFVSALIQRPDFVGTGDPLKETFFAPLPLRASENDLTINVSLLEPGWARNILAKDLAPYEDLFFAQFLRSDVLHPKMFPAIVQEIVINMDEQTESLRQALDQGRSGNGTEQLEGLA